MHHHIFNNKQFSNTFENAFIGIIVVNSAGEIEAANKYVLTEFGYNTEELLHQKIELLVPAKVREEHEKKRRTFFDHPASLCIPAERNLMGVKKDGTELPIELTLGFYEDHKDKYFIAFLNDTSRRKEAKETIKRLNDDLDRKVEENTKSLHTTIERLRSQIKEYERKDRDLEKALKKEQELNQLKSRFVSVASHEFRTPLSGVLASTYLLSKYTKSEEQPHRDRHIKRIITSVNLLNEVLGDFLSVDKMEQGDFKPNLTRFNISDAVNEVIQELKYVLKNGQEITYVHNGTSNIAYIDHSMFHRIMTNLLSNAIKYSHEDSLIEVVIEQEDPNLVITVKDNGIGIPKNEQEHLFKRFFRSSNAVHIEGTGLGLNIVKKYVEVLDGSIICNSEVKKGTEFIITFNNQSEQYENSIDS
jgi:PAS domain S-box-containing protein